MTTMIRSNTQTRTILDRLAKKNHTAAELADVSTKKNATTAIYGLLNNLVERGLVEYKNVAGRGKDGRTVRVYAITTAGRAARKGA